MVPAKHPAGPWSDGVVEAAARTRLDEALAEFRGHGYDVSGEVGDANPVYAVTTALRHLDGPVAGIVVSTLPAGVSRWLHLDVVSRIRREVEPTPVDHVSAVTADAS